MSEGRALVRFHDWRAPRDRKAVTRRLWRCRCIGLVAVPVSIGLCDPGAAGRHVILLLPAADSGAEVRHRLLTYRIIKEICNAARELARFPAAFFSVLPDLFVAGDDTREIHSLAPGVANQPGLARVEAQLLASAALLGSASCRQQHARRKEAVK